MARGADTRERIERAALRLFASRGIEGTSIRDIARAAKISQSALYNHSLSKDELAWSLFESSFAATALEMRRLSREEDNYGGWLRAMIRYIFSQFDIVREMKTFMFTIRLNHLRQFCRPLANPYIVIRAVIADAIKSGEIPRQDLKLATALVTGMIMQVIDSKILGRIMVNLSGFANRAAAASLRLLGT